MPELSVLNTRELKAHDTLIKGLSYLCKLKDNERKKVYHRLLMMHAFRDATDIEWFEHFVTHLNSNGMK